MNKKRIIVFLILILPFFAFGVQKSEQAKNSSIIVTGYVVSKGNVPFTQAAIRGDDGNEYSLICSEKQKRRLLDLQGKHLRFTLQKNDEIFYVVKKYKIIK